MKRKPINCDMDAMRWVHDNRLYLETRNQLIDLMSSDEWDTARLQIVSRWLQEVSNGYAKLNEVWGVDSIAKLDRAKLIQNLTSLLETVKN